MNSSTRKLTLSAIMTALSVVLIWLSSLVPTGSLVLVALVGIVTGIVVMECGYTWSVMLYIVTSILNFLFNPDYGVTIFYALVVGWYPVVKSIIERSIANRKIQIAIKIILMAISIIALYFILSLFFHEIFDSLTKFLHEGIFQNLPLSLLTIIGIALLTFIYYIYDHALTLTLAEYSRRRGSFKQ